MKYRFRADFAFDELCELTPDDGVDHKGYCLQLLKRALDEDFCIRAEDLKYHYFGGGMWADLSFVANKEDVETVVSMFWGCEVGDEDFVSVWNLHVTEV